jgi:hypothetical protein
MTEPTVTNDLRNQIAEIENKRMLLTAERDDVSYDALVTRDKESIKRAADIGTELAKLDHEEAMLKAALSTSTRREAEAKVSKAASQKRADLEKAESLLPRVAEMAARLDDAMKTLREVGSEFERTWATIKNLSGSGPTWQAAKVHLERALRTGLRGLPLRVAMVPPNERHSVAELAEGWSTQVKNMAQNRPASAEASGRKPKTAVRAA